MDRTDLSAMRWVTFSTQTIGGQTRVMHEPHLPHLHMPRPPLPRTLFLQWHQSTCLVTSPKRTLNHRSTTRTHRDTSVRNHLHHPYTCRAPFNTTCITPSSGIIRLASSRALERTLNHRSTTNIRRDTSTRYLRSSGITVRFLHGRPSSQTTPLD